jgi:hypothetical protein
MLALRTITSTLGSEPAILLWRIDTGRTGRPDRTCLSRASSASTRAPAASAATRYVAKLGVELPGLLVSIPMTAFIT